LKDVFLLGTSALKAKLLGQITVGKDPGLPFYRRDLFYCHFLLYYK
jgi:hypothetical protein